MSVTQISLAWIAGVALARAAVTFPVTSLAAGLFAAVLWMVIAPVRGVGRGGAASLLLAALGAAALSAYSEHVPARDISRHASADKQTITGRILCPIEHGPGKETFVLAVTEVAAGGAGPVPATGRLRVSVYQPPPPIPCGSAVAFSARIRRPRNFESPGTFDFVSHLADQRILALASVSRWDDLAVLAPPSRWAWRSALERFRGRAAETFDRAADSDEAGILKAMVIGDTGSVPADLRRRYAASGVAHLLAISGIHVGFIALFLFGLFRAGFRLLPDRAILALNRSLWTASRLAALATLPCIVVYAFLAGAHLSTLRAATMISVALSGLLIHRETRVGPLLAAAALILLAANPSALWNIGFQLSFVSVLSLVVLADRRRIERDPLLPVDAAGRWERFFSRVKDLLWVSTAATLGTAPLTALYFHQVSIIGLAVNLVLVPLAGIVVLPLGFTAVVLTAIWTPAANVTACLAGMGVAFMSDVARWAASVPHAVLHPASPPLYLVGAYYLLSVGALYPPAAAARAACATGWLMVVAVALTRPWGGIPPGEIRAAFLDVGQGDSAVIETTREVIVIDGGGSRSESLDLGEAVVEPYLWERGIRRVNWVVATHPQLDHMEGLLSVLHDFEIGRMLDGGVERDWPISREWDAVASARGIPKIAARPGLLLLDGAAVRSFVLWPSEEARRRAASGRDLNDASVVVKVRNARFSFLFTGDLQARGEADLAAGGADLPCDVLKVPHHGSRGSLDRGFLSRVRPGIAVISAGAGNRYGHPSEEALAAYASMGSAIFRTDREGTVVIETRGGFLRIRRTAVLRLRPVRWNRRMIATEWENVRRTLGAGWEEIAQERWRKAPAYSAADAESPATLSMPSFSRIRAR